MAKRKKKSETSLEQLEDRFFANSIDMLCFLDFNGHFKRLNPAWEQTLGFTREELMSRPFIEFVHPDDRERTLKQNGQVRGGGQALAFGGTRGTSYAQPERQTQPLPHTFRLRSHFVYKLREAL